MILFENNSTSILFAGRSSQLSSTEQPVIVASATPPEANNVVNLAVSTRSISPSQSSVSSAVMIGNSPEGPRYQAPSFYGVTSHPHVASPGEESQPAPFDDFDVVGIAIDPNSLHLRDHLCQSFFKYQTLWVDIVNKPTFLAAKAAGNNSRWYSEFLENAMLACATRLSTSKSVRALGSKFCELAKDDVLKAMSEPSPANLQGFLLLSEYEVSHGNDRPGWMFCGKSPINSVWSPFTYPSRRRLSNVIRSWVA
jgi:hypothetical protein